MSASLTDRQRRSFDELVAEGVYSEDFEHAPAAKSFVASVLKKALPHLPDGHTVNVLDCGCGTGAWLAFLGTELTETGITRVRLCGFDLSDSMIEVAHRRLAGLASPGDLHPGDLLDEASYCFEGADDGFDVVFAYDVVQQLASRDQYAACERIAGRLKPGGVALIFDNDSHTNFGRRMAWRKFLTRYFGLRLVPSYYCNAAYPPLERFRQRLAAGAWDATIQVRQDQVKRALVLTKPYVGKAVPIQRAEVER